MSKEYKQNLSIIIPHYNTPDLLGKLIDSIPDTDDIQIIVVDDRINTKTKLNFTEMTICQKALVHVEI